MTDLFTDRADLEAIGQGAERGAMPVLPRFPQTN